MEKNCLVYYLLNLQESAKIEPLSNRAFSVTSYMKWSIANCIMV